MAEQLGIGDVVDAVINQFAKSSYLNDVTEAAQASDFEASPALATKRENRRFNRYIRKGRVSDEYIRRKGHDPALIRQAMAVRDEAKERARENAPRRPVSLPDYDPAVFEAGQGLVDAYDAVAEETPAQRVANIPSRPVGVSQVDYTGAAGVPEYTPEYVAKAVKDVESGRYDPERIGRDALWTGMSIPMTAFQMGLNTANPIVGGVLDPLINRFNEGMDIIKQGVASPQLLESERAVQQQIANRDFAGTLGTIAENPGWVLSEAIRNMGSMAVPTAVAGGAAKAAQALPWLGRLVSAEKAAELGSVVGNIAMNTGSTFSDKDMQGLPLWKRYLAGGISGLGTGLVGAATEGGAEGQIARRLFGNEAAGEFNPLALLGSASKEAVQELGEGISDYGGQKIALDEPIDLQEAVIQNIPDALMGAITGAATHVGTSLDSSVQQQQQQQAQPELPSASEILKAVSDIYKERDQNVGANNLFGQETQPAPNWQEGLPKPQQRQNAQPAKTTEAAGTGNVGNPIDVVRQAGGVNRNVLTDLGWNDKDIAKLPDGLVAKSGGMNLEQTADVLNRAGFDTDVEALVDYASRPMRENVSETQQAEKPSEDWGKIFGKDTTVPQDWDSGLRDDLMRSIFGQETQPSENWQQGLPEAPKQQENTQQTVQEQPKQAVQAPETAQKQQELTRADTQNRDRDSQESIVQINSIAANPDYGRLGVTNDFGNGSPVVYGDDTYVAKGNKGVMVAADGRRIPFQYGVVEADRLIPSNDYNGRKVEEYDTGAPGKLRPIAGNGRTAGLQLAYKKGTAQNYRNDMAADGGHGVPKSAIDRMNNPVLVRVMPESDVTPDLADLSNQTGQASLGTLERARQDARRIDFTKLEFDDKGRVTDDSAKAFIAAMPPQERNALMLNGRIDYDAKRRMLAALFMDAWDSRELAAEQLVADPSEADARNILNGLARVAHKAVQLKGKGEFDIRSEIVRAAEDALGAYREDKPLKKYVKEGQLEGMERGHEADVILQMFADNFRSGKAIAENLERLIDGMIEAYNATQDAMFGSDVGRNEIFSNWENSLNGDQQRSEEGVQQPGRTEHAEGDDGGTVQAERPQTDTGETARTEQEKPSRTVQQEQEEGLALSPTTPEQLKAEDEAKQAKEKQAVEEERKEQQKKEADAQRDNFVLSGSERDVDELEARGQGSMWDAFDAKEEQKVEEPKQETPKADYGTKDNLNTENIAKEFARLFREGTSFKNINQARKVVADLVGVGKYTELRDQFKVIEESIELGLIIRAREIVDEGGKPVDVYRKLVDLYNQQPILGSRTSTSIAMQAYSTPVPLAYLADKLAGVGKDTIVYEPSAGHGALLLGVKPENAIVNELDKDRAARLSTLGFDVTTNDASDYAPNRKPDAVVANPPFGTVKVDGKNKVFSVMGINTTEIDQAISLKALDTLPADGRAVLIIGGKQGNEETRSKKYNTAAQRRFYATLSQNFNIVDHFSIDGKLYSKQGAGFPIDFIVIDGRHPTENFVFPAAKVPPVFNSFAELEEKFNNVPTVRSRPDGSYQPEPLHGKEGNQEQQGAVDRSGQDAGETSGERVSERTEGEREAGGKRPRQVERVSRNQGERPGSSERSGVEDTRRNGNDNGNNVSDRVEPRVSSEDRASGKERTGRTDVQRSDARARSNDAGLKDASKAQQPYTPKSGGRSLDTLVPSNMQEPVRRSLDNVSKKRGDLDRFVAKELGYKDVSEMHHAFAAEQVDALSLALDNIKDGKGFIIGDQTGIGKGRVCAGIIRWAKANGKVPVFVTMKPDLYADMMRDLNDIGTSDVKPFITNKLRGKDALVAPDGSELASLPESKYKQAMSHMQKTGKLAEDVDAIFTTYAQLSAQKGKSNPRQDMLMSLAKNAVLILDEAHNAGGVESSVGKFVRSLQKVMDGGVLYSSATFAKRPEIMSLYNKTDLSSIGTQDEINDLTVRGGLPMQQAISAMLAESGQYIRREKSFEGVKMGTSQISVDTGLADTLADSMSSVMEFSELVEDISDAIDKRLKAEGSALRQRGMAVGRVGASSISFGSLLHNIVSQSTLAIKSREAAQAAVEAIRNGEKPVITLSNTMGAAIDRYVKEKGLKDGDRIDITFADVLLRYLDASRTVKCTPAMGDPYDLYLTDADLGPIAVAAYNRAKEKIVNSDYSDLPSSPIDSIKYELQKQGLKAVEITGRSQSISYEDGVAKYRVRDNSTRARQKAITDFNSGDADVVILNSSGSTGISLHSSEKFADKRPRRMLILQPDLNIDVFMQTLGRVFRTGQVNLPAFDFLISDIPAEKRPAAVLGKKMASLNANTTASAKGTQSFENIPDFLNVYGDEAALSVLQDDPELNRRLGNILNDSDMDSDKVETDGLVAKFTGRIPLLNVKEQEDVYSRLESAFHDIIEVANATGTNVLDTSSKPLDAKLKDSEVFTTRESDSPFGAESVAGTYDVKILGKPYTSAQVNEHVEEGKKDAPNWRTIRQMRDKYEETHKLTEKESKKLERQYKKVDDFISSYEVGDAVRLNGGTGSAAGVIVGISYKGKEGSNPVLPSAWRVTVDLASAKRRVTVPLSRLVMGNSATAVEGSNKILISRFDGNRRELMAAYDSNQNEAREDRVIITGNLVRAYSDNGVGEIITFDTHDKKRLVGIMMPKSAGNMEEVIGGRPVRFTNAKQVLDFYNNAEEGFVSSTDNKVRISRSIWGTTVYVPGSKAEGGKYFLDEKLREFGEFRKRSGEMQLQLSRYASDETIKAIIKRLQDLDVKFVATHSKEVARKIVGDNTKYSRTTETREKSGSTVADIERAISSDPVNKVATVVQSAEDLPARIRPQDGSTVEGAYVDGNKIYIVADSVTPERAVEVARHEVVGHYGIEAMLGKELMSRTVDQVNNALERNKALAELAEEVDRRQPGLDAQTRAKEVIAMMAERNMHNGVVRRVLNAVRRFLAKLGLIKSDTTDADVAKLLRDARKYLADNGRAMVGGDAAPLYSVAPPISNKKQARMDLHRAEWEDTGYKEGWRGKRDEFVENARRYGQDRMIDIKAVQKMIEDAGGKVTEREDVYGKEELYSSRLQARIDRMEEDWFKPIKEAIQKSGMTLQEVDDWLAARHVLLDKVNQKLQDMNPDLPNNDRLTGKSDDEWQTIFHKGAGNEELYKVGRLVDAFTRRNVQQRVTNGLMTKEEADQWLQYKHYVPLKRDIADGGIINGRSKGYQVKGKESKRRMGSEAQVRDVVANLFGDAITLAQRIEKARVGRALLDLARNHPNDSFWTVDLADKVKRVDPNTGLVETYYRNQNLVPADNVFVVKENGVEHWVKFNANNERAMNIARALKNLDIESTKGVVGMVGKLTRYMGSWMTTKNPAFMFSNFLRDMQDAAFNIEGTAIEGKQAQLIATVPSALKAIWHMERGTENSNTDMAKYAREFREAGGETAYLNLTRSVDEQRKRIEAELKELAEDGQPSLKKTIGAVGDFIMDANSAVENSVRLATYVTGRKAGLSKDKAASLAKNVTVNFNRRGASTGVINSLYLFANANIQGHVRMLTAFAKSRRGRYIGGGLVLASFALSMIGRAAMGDDWDNLPEWEKANNWLIPIGKKDYFKIPIGPGLKLFHYAGMLMEDMIFGKKKRTVMETALDIALTIVDNFNVIGSGGSPGQVISPTVFRPIVQLWENKTFSGSPIHHDEAPFGGYNPPAYQKAFKTTPLHWKKISEGLNRLSGGDDVTPGVINFAPESIGFAVKSWMLPGAANEIDRTLTALERVMGDDVAVSPRMVPLLNRVYGQVSEGNAENQFYRNVAAIRQQVHQIHEYEKEERDADFRKAVTKFGEGDYDKGMEKLERYEDFTKELGAINRDRNQARKDGDNDLVKRIEAHRMNVYDAYNNGEPIPEPPK